ncbi:MAG: ArsA family ATPase [Candidatus Methanoperedens sp.]|nr:ArsA family ATPase [Candidatus Methanoperedens sp.]MCE8428121.1 ArsA family ATPase [Candidatus Methanoperedens sp.]
MNNKAINRLIEPKQKGKTKFIFFSCKGGVGKSTMSCATAVCLARNGYKTLIVTTDPAPNLLDIFGQHIGHKISAINNIEYLFAIEINSILHLQDILSTARHRVCNRIN